MDSTFRYIQETEEHMMHFSQAGTGLNEFCTSFSRVALNRNRIADSVVPVQAMGLQIKTQTGSLVHTI